MGSHVVSQRFKTVVHPSLVEGTMAGKNDASHNNSQGRRKWSAAVSTDSTHPRAGLFNKDAQTIARALASKKVSPKGPSKPFSNAVEAAVCCGMKCMGAIRQLLELPVIRPQSERVGFWPNGLQ